MPPAQRKMMEDMFSGQGLALRPGGGTIQVCLTQADIDRFRTELENMLKLLAEATQAGIDAERGDSHCERALTGMRALVDHVAEKRGEPARPIDGPAFIQTCEGFDVEIQRCIVLSYSQAHQDECSAVIDAAPPGTVERIQALLGSN